jgi:GNAT superfamily N-acetyltransferase
MNVPTDEDPGAPRPKAERNASRGDVCLRPARPGDVAAVVGLIRELAAFEKLSHLVVVTPESLTPHLFGPRPAAECVVAQAGTQLVAFALFFNNFSTFLGKPGLYLEDLYVQPAWRGQGLGGRLLRHLAGVALERGAGRFEWSVLDWNAQAIRFYEGLGATVMPDWRICRVTGPALAGLATTRDGEAERRT